MLTDTSEKFQATWEFLDARITEAIELGDMPQNVRRWFYRQSNVVVCDSLTVHLL